MTRKLTTLGIITRNSILHLLPDCRAISVPIPMHIFNNTVKSIYLTRYLHKIGPSQSAPASHINTRRGEYEISRARHSDATPQGQIA